VARIGALKRNVPVIVAEYLDDFVAYTTDVAVVV
jgi:hypothetical protein